MSESDSMEASDEDPLSSKLIQLIQCNSTPEVKEKSSMDKLKAYATQFLSPE